MKKIEPIELVVYPETGAPWEEIQHKLNELIDAVNELTSTKSLPYVEATFNPPYGKSKEQRRGEV